MHDEIAVNGSRTETLDSRGVRWKGGRNELWLGVRLRRLAAKLDGNDSHGKIIGVQE